MWAYRSGAWQYNADLIIGDSSQMNSTKVLVVRLDNETVVLDKIVTIFQYIHTILCHFSDVSRTPLPNNSCTPPRCTADIRDEMCCASAPLATGARAPAPIDLRRDLVRGHDIKIHLVPDHKDEVDLVLRPNDEVNLILGYDGEVPFAPWLSLSLFIFVISVDKVGLVRSHANDVDPVCGHESTPMRR